MLTAFGTGQGFAKVGVFGFAKSGKSFTSALLAIEIHKQFGIKTPIAAFDSEGGIEYITPMVKKATGLAPIGMKSRSLKDLLNTVKDCESGAASILIVDSISHVWKEVCSSYLDQVNKARDSMNRPRRQRLEFSDWSTIKDYWHVWTDAYLNSKLHIITCGRATWDWDFEEVEDTNGSVRKELRKTGTRMAVEREFGFESSLLIEMDRVQIPIDGRPGHFSIVHRATIIGDRFNEMDGSTIDNPTGEWFRPHLTRLVPGAENIIDTTSQTDMNIDEAGDAEYNRDRRQRTILAEEIQGEMLRAWPGQTKEEKLAKVKALEACFQTKSWTKVEQMGQGELRNGLQILRAWIEQNGPVAAAGKDGDE